MEVIEELETRIEELDPSDPERKQIEDELDGLLGIIYAIEEGFISSEACRNDEDEYEFYSEEDPVEYVLFPRADSFDAPLIEA